MKMLNGAQNGKPISALKWKVMWAKRSLGCLDLGGTSIAAGERLSGQFSHSLLLYQKCLSLLAFPCAYYFYIWDTKRELMCSLWNTPQTGRKTIMNLKPVWLTSVLVWIFLKADLQTRIWAQVVIQDLLQEREWAKWDKVGERVDKRCILKQNTTMDTWGQL